MSLKNSLNSCFVPFYLPYFQRLRSIERHNKLVKFQSNKQVHVSHNNRHCLTFFNNSIFSVSPYVALSIYQKIHIPVGLTKKKVPYPIREKMAVNPQLFPNGMPVPFTNELFVLSRDGVEFEIDKIPGVGKTRTKGTVYLSNIRIVFVTKMPEDFIAFDMPLLFISDEKFKQPVFHCNNISGHVDPVVPDNENRALYSTHSFKILFKDGGCGTFVPLFFNLIASVRRAQQQSGAEPRADPLQAAQTPVDDMIRHAYVDPNDPTKIYLQQPTPESQLRRRSYQSQPA